MEISQHITALESDGALLADAAASAGLTEEVPACPGWRVRDLVRHQAFVHAWAARHVTERRARVIEDATEDGILGGGPPDGELLAAYREGHAALTRTLRDADPDVRCATFLPAPSPLAFWARRQAHETAIHRFDAQSTRRGDAPVPRDAFDPGFAADGIDELVRGFAARQKTDGALGELLVRSADTEDAWRFTWRSEGSVRTRRYRAGEETGPADCVLAGPASGVYLFLWNRCAAADADITIAGDQGILRTWSRRVRVRWT
ncbi:MAG TPA: maleylpyruvate isomerase family mycothiol-dependent enzyme [Trebonia sp.]